MKSNLLDLRLMIIHQTDDAVLLATDEEATPKWVPKSQCEVHPPDSPNGMIVDVTMPEHVAIEKGFA